MTKSYRPLAAMLLASSALIAPQVAHAQVQPEAEVEELQVLGRYIPEVMRETSEVTTILATEDLARQGDDNAAQALTRMTGLSVVGGRFVYVRGLGERYSSALLNGSPLPSPEPLQRVVPLDLFPSNILAGVTVQKTYSVNYPGEFGGGVIDLQTLAVPDEPFFSIGFSVGANDETSLRRGLTYFGGESDWTGFDDGTREMPKPLLDAVNTGKRVGQGAFSDAELATIGRSFQNANINLLQSTNSVPLNGSVDVAAGRSFGFDWGSLGVVGVFGYDNGWQTRRATQQEGVVSLGELAVQEDLQSNSTQNDIVVNGLVSLALDLDNHDFKWTNLYVRNTTKETRSVEGESARASNFIRDDYTAWYQRELIDTQLSGAHVFGDLRIDWRGSYARTERDAPYERQVRYRRLADGRYYHNPQQDLNTIRFSEVEDTAASFGLDVRYETELGPIKDVTLAGGYAWYDNDRYSDQRVFRFNMNSTPSLAFQLQRVDFLYSDYNIGPNGLFLQEITGADGAAAYEAGLQTQAVYVQAEGEIMPLVRATVGLRYETGEQEVGAIDLFSTTRPSGQRLENEYLLPAATVTWNFAEDQQLRLGVSKTIARPQFREQAPQLYLDPESDRLFIGNPYLVDSELVNVDGRYERYFERGQFLTVGAFYKDIDKPIESIVNESGSGLQQSFLNAPRAVLYGAEIEFKKFFEPSFGIGFIDAQRWLVAANYTWSKAEVRVESGDVVFPRTGSGLSQPATNYVQDGSRLQGQSEHLANVQFGFENDATRTQATFLVTYASERTTARGPAGQPDFVQDPGVMLDFTFRQGFEVWGQEMTFGLEARNLLGIEFEEYQELGGTRLDLNRYELGRSVSLSLSARF